MIEQGRYKRSLDRFSVNCSFLSRQIFFHKCKCNRKDDMLDIYLLG